jgi:predicted DsbA family dithiol-disulfide isomerase
VHFPLHPDTPAQGQLLEELFRGRDIDLQAAHARMQALMDAEGLPYRSRTHTYNSRLAQELAKWAETRPSGEAIHDALFQAYFRDGRNIGDSVVLVDIARSIGLPADEAADVLRERRYSPDVDADWSKSREYGVTGVPTFVSGRRAVVGAQPYETLAQLLRQENAIRRTEPGGDNTRPGPG